MKEIQINGVLAVPDTDTEDSIWDQFIEWVESKGYSFGGSIQDITNDNPQD